MSVCDVRALWPNGWTDQHETWHAGRPRPWPHCVRWGRSSPPYRGTAPPIFGPYLMRPNGCMDQDVTWYGDRPWPRGLCVRWGSSPPSSKRGRSPLPKFLAHVYCGQTTGWIKMALGMEVGLSPGDFVRWGLSPLPKRGGTHSPIFSPYLLRPNGWVDEAGTWHGGRPQPR